MEVPQKPERPCHLHPIDYTGKGNPGDQTPTHGEGRLRVNANETREGVWKRVGTPNITCGTWGTGIIK